MLLSAVSTSSAEGPVGQVEWTTDGTYNWTVPDNVYSVCILCVGGGGGGGSASPQDADGGGGGGLAYKNNVSVTPGDTHQIYVAEGGIGGSGGGAGATGGNSTVSISMGTSVVAYGGVGGSGSAGTGGAGGGRNGADGGGNGGNGGAWNNAQGGGGGAGGYSGNGGVGSGSGMGASGGGAGGGGGGGFQAGGGGVGIFGEGSSGGPSDSSTNYKGFPGSGGKGGYSNGAGPNGASDDGAGIYGGGGWAGGVNGTGGKGGVRIIWWGPNSPQRAFPTSNVSQTTKWSQDYKNLANSNNRYLYFQKKRTDSNVLYPHENWKNRNKNAENYTIGVTNSGASAYVLNGTDGSGSISGNNVTVQARVGDTLTFNVSVAGHPFWIKTANTNGTGSGADGVTNNGAESGTVTWTPSSPGTYYYICQYHGGMVGTITITDGGITYPRPRKVITKTEQFPEIYQWNFNVSAAGGLYVFASSYDRDGTVSGNQPIITVRQGDNIQFTINAAGHPFWISNRQGAGQPSPSETPGGITNNGTVNAVLVWDTTGITPGTYWYNCQYHTTMYGNIVITS